MAVRQPRERQSKIRIDRKRLLKTFYSAICVFLSPLVPEETALEIKLIGLSIPGVALHQALFLRA